jgi:hypothetical protein
MAVRVAWISSLLERIRPRARLALSVSPLRTSQYGLSGMRKQPTMRTEGNAHAAANNVLYDESSGMVTRENATEAAMMRPMFYC